MARVVIQAVVSVDGFIAYPDDSVGELFDWYFDGPETVESFGAPTFRMHEPSASILRDAFAF
ncbi:MAG: hypothetical protein QOG57_4856, partial [Pseudonocardiales bacterium]|nr:hypothetical protein [Pseudonocardiales bacterium]